MDRKKLLNETKIEYQNLSEENKQLKENKKNKDQQQQQQQKEELERQKKNYQTEK